MLLFVFLVIVSIFTHNSMSHTYSPGSCPNVEPIHDFDMTKVSEASMKMVRKLLSFFNFVTSFISHIKFLGRWYAMQKTTTEYSCLIYDFKEGTRPGEYYLEQTSERYPTNLNISYVFDYTGKIRADKNSSTMTIHFPLS